MGESRGSEYIHFAKVADSHREVRKLKDRGYAWERLWRTWNAQ